jgi:hypothetical protein
MLVYQRVTAVALSMLRSVAFFWGSLKAVRIVSIGDENGSRVAEVPLANCLVVFQECFLQGSRCWFNQPSMAVCQNLAPLVNIKIAGKWMFIPLKMVLIGIDPYPYKDWNWSLSIVYPEMVDFQRNSCVSDMVPQCTPGEVFQALSS